jgi:hypothetical protein
MTTDALTLRQSESLVAWELSPIETRHFPGVPAPARDPQDYKFINGFVDVGDLPCRIATWEEVKTRTVSLRRDWPVESLYLPGTSRRVEFPCFHNTPTRLARWCRTYLRAPEDGDVAFMLATAGGVRIWVDGVLAAKFEPFLRNGFAQTEITLPLKAAGSEVVVLTEEMAERDTNWFFELRLESDATLFIELPGLPDGRHAEALQALASEIRPAGEFVSEGPFILTCDTPPGIDVEIEVKVCSTSHAKDTFLERRIVLPAGARQVQVCKPRELPEGYHAVALTFHAEGSRRDRNIAVAVLGNEKPTRDARPLGERKRAALSHMAAHGENRMGTALAMLASGKVDTVRFRAIVENTLSLIDARADCSDFVMVPLLWAYWRHRKDFPADLAERTRAAALGYRYWVDEPGNDVMWFWSENHALCFHVSQLLAGALFPEARFSASGRTGAEQHRLAVARLHRWFDAVEAEGLAEWNSAAYYPVDLIGLLALVEFAPRELAGRARLVTDRVFTMAALHSLGGVPAGTMGRAYDKELRAGPLTELAPFVALAFGAGWYNRGVAALPMFAAGRYEPPPGLAELAEPAPGEVITAEYLQGYGGAARLHLFKTRAVQLSSNSAARPGGYGHQQHVIDILFAAHPFARVWINHPGEDDPWGQNRPSYWAGNGSLPRVGQRNNVALALYDLGESPRVGFTHAYVSVAGLATERVGNWLLVRSGEGLAAIGATEPLEAVSRGPGAGREYRAHARRCGWAVIAAETADMDAFRTQLAGARLRLDGEGDRLRLDGLGVSLELGWNQGLHVNGETAEHAAVSAEPRFERRRVGA